MSGVDSGKIRNSGVDENGKTRQIDVDVSGGATSVNNRSGTGKLGRNRDLQNVTTIQSIEWPAGSNIKYLNIFVGLNAVPPSQQDILPLHAKMVVDAISLPVATNLMANMNSGVVDTGWIPLTFGFNSIPLTKALVNGALGGGTIHIESSDVTKALNLWVGAS